MRRIWLLPSPSLTANPMLYCFFFALIAVNFHSPGDIQLVKLSSISSGQVLVLLSTKIISVHIRKDGNSNVFVRYFKNILMEYHITTADHMLGSLIVKVIPISSYCWFQVDTLCNPESELLNFATLHLEAFALESVKDTHIWLCTTPAFHWCHTIHYFCGRATVYKACIPYCLVPKLL
jgi:hypothetical protein